MSFPLLKLTNAGRQLIIKAHTGDCSIVFTRLGIGNGDPPNDLNSITTLMNTIKTVSINTITQGEGSVTLSCTLDNANLQAGFWWKEIGVYATDPDIGEVLYAYAHSGEFADFIPAFTTQNYFRTTINLTVVVGDATNVSAVIGEYVGYATTEEFDDHKNDNTNPHRVTAEQVGLGNVPNVATNDQQPTYSAANSVAEINSGENLSVVFGKIKTAIAALIAHFNATNPHFVTKAQVGLGNVPNVKTNDQTPTYTEAINLANLTSGEKMNVAFGKLKKGLSSLISHLSDTNNPHGVTKSHVGLGNVPNVTTNEQTPTFTEADTLANITSGETLTIILGKVKKALGAMIDHITEKNGTFTLASGLTAHYARANIRQIGHVVYVEIYVTLSTTETTNSLNLGTVTGVDVPSVTRFFNCIVSGNLGICAVLSSNNTMQLAVANAESGAQTISSAQLEFSYYVD